MNTTMFDIKSKIKQIKNTVLQMTPLEIKVRECTSNDSWGVKLSDKLEVADHTFNYEDFKLIFSVIRIRLADVGKDWRHVQKGIQLIEFLVINGSERCLDEARDMQSLIRQMKNFKYTDDEGKDWGINVRDAAKHFLEFIKDEEKIKEEREIAKQQKERYEGFSRSEAKYKSRTTSGTSEKKKEKKPSYDDEYDAPKKSTSRSSFEEEESYEEEKPRAVSPVNNTGRPRKPSTGTTPSFQTTTTSQPVKQKEDTLIDFFDTPVTTTNQYNNNAYGNNNNGFGNNGFGNNSGWSQPSNQPVNTGFNPRTAGTQPTNSGFNPRNTGNNASFNTGGNDFEANFDSSGFDDGFGTNDAFNNPSGQEKKDSTLFDISSGLVNLDLNETKQQQSQPVNPTQQSANMSLKELKRLQGNNTPTKPQVMNNTTTSFPPSNTSFPPNNNFGGGYPNNNGFNNYPPNNNNFGNYPNNNMPPRNGAYPPNNNFGNMPPAGGYGYNNQPVNNQRPPQNNNNGGGFDFF